MNIQSKDSKDTNGPLQRHLSHCHAGHRPGNLLKLTFYSGIKNTKSFKFSKFPGRCKHARILESRNDVTKFRVDGWGDGRMDG